VFWLLYPWGKCPQSQSRHCGIEKNPKLQLSSLQPIIIPNKLSQLSYQINNWDKTYCSMLKYSILTAKINQMALVIGTGTKEIEDK
jgi:hypothetical protein